MQVHDLFLEGAANFLDSGGSDIGMSSGRTENTNKLSAAFQSATRFQNSKFKMISVERIEVHGAVTRLLH
jgi:hypothetical protein